MKRLVRGILERKGKHVHTVRPDETVYDALEVMAEHNIGSVLVMDGDRMVGILTERDYARKVILAKRASIDTAVSEIMTAEVVTVALDDDVDHCMQLMTDRRFRHLPVTSEDGSVLGLVSIGDVVFSIIESQQSLINDLERYITQ